MNKLLQRDVDYGVLKKPATKDQESDDEHDDSENSLLEGGSVPLGFEKEGQNGYSYGYGKAFEYDQSF